MKSTKLQIDHRNYQSWLGVLALVAFALLYCFWGLISPFWNDHDTWSNLLPVIHFRHSILTQHTLPLYTDLWYGGRAQWANPLWNFLYLPSTLIWLITPLDWGTRIVFLSHLIFSLVVGRMLAGLFLESEVEKSSAAIIFTSPILPALTAGHVEKALSWGWILLALYFIFNTKLTSSQRGLGGGICFGIIPLTGANYYAFYTGILLLPLALSYKDAKLFLSFCLGSLIGLLHLPSVLHLIGHSRDHAKTYVEIFSVNLFTGISALAVGFSKPFGWETWTPIGIFTCYLFGSTLARKLRKLFLRTKYVFSTPEIALLISVFLLFLLASGVAYQGQSWFDQFRVPSRALVFVALGVALFVFVNARETIELEGTKRNLWKLFLFTSAVQIVISTWIFSPAGSVSSPYEASVQHMANTLKRDHAKSVWITTRKLEDMYIHVGLTQNNLALPNVYYGDMGQTIEVSGTHCGYSFDHLVIFAPVKEPVLELYAVPEWSSTRGRIARDNLFLLEQIKLKDKEAYIYRVVCDQ